MERSGAAQGLAEVLRVAGATKVEALLPGVLEGCRSKSASAREGYLTLFKFLPLVMAQGFQVGVWTNLLLKYFISHSLCCMVEILCLNYLYFK